MKNFLRAVGQAFKKWGPSIIAIYILHLTIEGLFANIMWYSVLKPVAEAVTTWVA